MPSALIYLGIMLAVIFVWFVFMKHPVYEVVLIAGGDTAVRICDFIYKR